MDQLSDAERFYHSHRGFFDAHRIPKAAAFRFLGTLASDPNSAFYTTLGVSGAGSSSGVSEATVQLERRRLNFVLTQHQQSVLQAAWGDVFNLEFTQSIKAGHPMPAAFRILEVEVLLSLCDHSHPIVDAGGNHSHHVRHGRRHVHCCCPLTQLRDKARYASRMLELKTTVGNLGGRTQRYVKEVLEKPSLAVCNNKAEDCKVYAKTMLWVHSTYDMKVDDLARQMDAHGAEVGYGVFMYTDLVIDESAGRIPEMDAVFDREGPNIRFGFQNDPSFMYIHEWAEYLKFLVDRVINGNKFSYYYRVFPTNRGSMMFSVTRLDTTDVVPVMVKDNLVVRSRPTLVSVMTYDVDWTKASSDPKFIVTSEVKIPPEFYHQAMSFCFARMRDETNAQPLDEHQFARHCRTYNRYVDVNTRAIFSVEKVPVKVFAKVCTALFNMAALITAYRRVHTGLVIKDMQKRRALADGRFFGNLFRYCGTFLPNARTFQQLVDGFRIVLLTKVNKDLMYVVAEEESRYRMMTTVSPVATMVTAPMQRAHIREKDLSEDWHVSDDDIQIMADVLEAEGSSDQSKALRDKLIDSVSTTQVPSVAESEKGEDQSEEDDEDGLQKRLEVTGLSHDPIDRQAANTYRIGAIDEYVRYCRASYDKDIASVRSQVLESWTGTQPAKYYCHRKQNSVEAPNYLMFAGGVMTQSILPLTSDKYMWGMDPYTMELVRIVGSLKPEEGGSLKAKHKGWLFVSSELMVLNSHQIADAIETDLSSNGYGDTPVVYLSEGVAGSGKSSRIRAAFQPSDLILTATTGCRKQMIQELLPGGKQAPKETVYTQAFLESHIKTVDAYLMHGGGRFDVIRFDEALLLHFGAIASAAVRAGCKLLYLSGDKVQIPFLNRIASLLTLRYSSLQYFDHYEIWIKSYRLTQDVMKGANKWYYNGLGRTCNPIGIGVELIRISDPSDPRVTEIGSRVDMVMGFYKAEKAELKKRTRCSDVRTVHEAQGEDVKTTMLARLNDKDVGGLYSGPKEGGNGHPLVGYTRSSEKVYVVHRGGDDFLMEFYRTTQEFQHVDSYKFNSEVHDAVQVHF